MELTTPRPSPAAPPPIVSPLAAETRTPAGSWSPVWLVAALAAGAGLVRLCVQWNVPLPFCWLRATTGIPCPGCGCTRSLLAWTHLDPLAALQFNPLFFAITLGAVAWTLRLAWFHAISRGVGAVSAPLQGHRDGPGSASDAGRLDGGNWMTRPWAPWLLAGLAFLNWLYLCLTLPK